MAATKKVMFEPSIPPGKPASAAKASLPNFEEDELLDKPTILRIKRRRTDSPVDVVVIEAQFPNRKKKVMQELTDAMQGMTMAQELHKQYEEHVKNTTASKATKQGEEAPSNEDKSGLPPLPWALPSKSLESKMRKVFRLIGSDDASKPEGDHVATVLNDAQSGKMQRRDILQSLKPRTYEDGLRKRTEEAQKRVVQTRLGHLRRLQQEVVRVPGEAIDEDDELCRMLELVSDEYETNAKSEESSSKPVTPHKAASLGGLQLPIVHSAKKLKEMKEQEAIRAAQDAAEFVHHFYVLDDGASLNDLEAFDSVQVPMSQFRHELLDDFVMEGEYSDDDDPEADSSDSQNKPGDWEYGSDRDDDGGEVGSSGDEDEEDEEYGEVDEIMDEDGEFYHHSYRHRGYDLEIDPNEGAGSSDDEF